MIRRPPRSTQSRSSAASDVYKRQLLDLQPEMANIYTENNQIKSIRVNTLRPNQEIQVLAGDRVPADCIVTQGNSYVDVSHITGESKPIEVKEGENLSSGSLNLNSTLRLKVQKVGGDSSLAKLVTVSYTHLTLPTIYSV